MNKEGPETKEFREWHKREVAKGLIDIKFVGGDGITKDTTREDFLTEINHLNRLIENGEIVNRPDVY